MDLPRPAVIVALLTPYERGGGVDDGAMRAHVDWLVEAGVDALMPCGTTGEGRCSPTTRLPAVVRATVAAAAGRVPVLAHVGRPGTAPTLALARRARGRRRGRGRRDRAVLLRRRPTTTCAPTTVR